MQPTQKSTKCTPSVFVMLSYWLEICKINKTAKCMRYGETGCTKCKHATPPIMFIIKAHDLHTFYVAFEAKTQNRLITGHHGGWNITRSHKHNLIHNIRGSVCSCSLWLADLLLRKPWGCFVFHSNRIPTAKQWPPCNAMYCAVYLIVWQIKISLLIMFHQHELEMMDS